MSLLSLLKTPEHLSAQIAHGAQSTSKDHDNGGSADGQFQTGDFSVDEYRPIKVICIGAGFSGIVAGIRYMPSRVPNLDLKIYEKADGIGGTWYANRYPGLACDIPSHCTQWSSFYAPGPEILAYMRRVAEKYKLSKYIRLQHELTHARWNETSGKWELRIRRPRVPRNVDNRLDGIMKTIGTSPISNTPANDIFEEFEDTADILFLGTGALSRWSWPDIDGLKNFKGRLIHSAQWDVSDGTWEDSAKDWCDKIVGVVGLGSSAIQIVPALQPKVKKIINLVRGKTWISSSFSESKLSELLSRESGTTNYIFTDADRERFKDPDYYKYFRHELESDLNASILGFQPHSARNSEMQKTVAAALKATMLSKLADKPEIAEYIVPSFDADFETTPIQRITETGIEFVDGRHTELDVLVCATGFDTTFRLPFGVIGRHGRDLRKRWEPHASAYLSIAVDDFPNMFMATGPNSFVNSGSLLVIIERQVDYAVAATLKLQRERLKSIEVKLEAITDYEAYIKAYFTN
ncbi:hypothetical protein EW146_g6563, partial [Bondarzewia mesenterica]